MDRFTKAMFETALWSETDEDGQPLEASADLDDFAKPVRAALEREAARFQEENGDDIAVGPIRGRGSSDERAGHDFWLTRNGHGAGFWDGDWPEPQASRLTEAAKRYGRVELYLGDDRKIWAAGYEDLSDFGDVVSQIWEQLGRARVMIGARDPVSSRSGTGRPMLTFRIGSNPKRVNWIRIIYDPSDTYTVQFGRGYRDPEVVSEVEDVYVDRLAHVIERHTGLRTSL